VRLEFIGSNILMQLSKWHTCVMLRLVSASPPGLRKDRHWQKREINPNFCGIASNDAISR
jgi:uncharacterized protein YfaT (DUF1175 family)